MSAPLKRYELTPREVERLDDLLAQCEFDHAGDYGMWARTLRRKFKTEGVEIEMPKEPT